MKFYNRSEELAEINRIQEIAFSEHSMLTVVTGRRRVGKTSLITRACEDSKTVYLFVSRTNEAVLCKNFINEISSTLDMFVPTEISSFASLFRFLMEAAQHQSFNLIIDEFQEFYSVNSSVYSEMQSIWDKYRLKTKVNLIVSGSVYSLMNKIFQNEKEPLFNRQNAIIRLKPFDTNTLKEILRDFSPNYKNDDLLALYTFTGGIPKYIEQFCDFGSMTKDAMIDQMTCENSTLIDEGKNILIEEFGKDYGTYFSILGAIAGGINTQPAIESILDSKSIGGYLKRLIVDYNIIRRIRPILSKEGTKSNRYEINDNFLLFWFRYFHRNRSMIEIGNYPALREVIRADYPTYSGKLLERYFIKRLAESFNYRDIGSWWERKGNQNEIDIVALGLTNNTAEVYEVKRQAKNFKPKLLEAKAEHLKTKALANYTIKTACLSLSDM